MRSRIISVGALLVLLAAAAAARERQWQTGTWVDVGVKRQMMDFGPGSSSFDPRGRGAGMRALAEVRTFVIETDVLRIELQDVVSVNHRSVDAVIGQPVTFALEKNTAYVKDEDGTEHKLRVTKKTEKARPQAGLGCSVGGSGTVSGDAALGGMPRRWRSSSPSITSMSSSRRVIVSSLSRCAERI